MTVQDIEHLPEAEYWIADELDPLGVWWFGADGNLVPFGTDAHSFVMSVVALSDVGTQIFSKSSGFVAQNGTGDGSDSADTPNLSVVWAVGSDLNTIPSAGRYEVTIVGTRIATQEERTAQIILRMKARH